jgi:hypothetical protein
MVQARPRVYVDINYWGALWVRRKDEVVLVHRRFVWRRHCRDLRLARRGSGSGKHVIPTIESRSSPATGTSRR